jgi:hypothetical protein
MANYSVNGTQRGAHSGRSVAVDRYDVWQLGRWGDSEINGGDRGSVRLLCHKADARGYG